MEFDDVIVKENPGLCRCCLSEGCYKELATEYIWMGENEVYADMLLECFDISISQNNEGPNGTNRLICEVCITRLRDACNFKKQVLECEKKFVDMVGRGDFKQRVTVDVLFEDNLKLEQNAEDQSQDTGNFDFMEEPMAFDDEINDDVTAEPLPVKGKRGRPKKSIKTVKKKEEKPKTSKAKGAKRQDMAEDVKSYSSTKRNRLMKRNAIIILESSTVVPFKWHRHNFLCFFCHRPFKGIGALKEHTKADHEKSSIKSAVSYLKRDEKVKIDVLNTRCRYCDQKFDDLNDIVEHSRSAHDKDYNEVGFGVVPYKLQENGFKCAECQESFEYFIKLNQHMNKHYGDYVCELCGKSFLSQDRLRCHSLSHGSAFHCNVCSEAFDSLTQRNTHETKVHNKDKSIRCFYCAETFQNYTLRKKHHNFVHNIEGPDIKCPVCDKSFQILSKMRVHLKEVHLREKNFACTVCGQRFFSRTHVQKHMIKHSGERVHECSVCKKAYARKQTLKDHMRIHNDKKYFCPRCNQSFAQNNSLRLHMKVHHMDSL